MSIVHVEQLDGTDAEKWLPYAKAELRRWDLADSAYDRNKDRQLNSGLGGNTRTRFLTPAEGVTIRLRQCGEFQYIAISVTGGTYIEFETSGFPVQVAPVSTTQGFEIFNAYMTAVVGVSFDGTTTKATLRGGKRYADCAPASLIGKSQQINLTDEPSRPLVDTKDAAKRTDTAKLKFPNNLYESFAPNHPFTGVLSRAWTLNSFGQVVGINRGSADAQLSRDVGFDVPYGDSRGTGRLREAFLNSNTSDWPRAAGRRTVTHPTFGTRTFAIYVDAFDQFFAFPTSQIEPLTNPPAQNVGAEYVQQAAISWPVWMLRKPERFRDFVGSGDDVFGTNGAIEMLPEYDWKLHPDGKKACAVVFARQPAIFDDGAGEFFDPADPAVVIKRVGTGGSLGFTDYDQIFTGLFAVPTIGLAPIPPPRSIPKPSPQYYIGTGLLEVALTIELTGANPQDFTFTAAVTEIRNPQSADADSQFCTFLAGYTHYDIPKGDGTYIANRGDLCVLDIERYYNAAYDGSATGYAVWSLLSLKNLTQAAELSTWFAGDYGRESNINPLVSGTTLARMNAGAARTRPTQLVDFDMATLSFVFGVCFTEYADNTGVSPAERNLVLHQAAAVVTFGKLATMLFPDGMQSAQRDVLTAYCQGDARAEMLAATTWTFIANNDTRTWADIAHLREYYSYTHGLRTDGSSPLPSTDAQNFWENGLSVAAATTIPLLTQTPYFGWYVYTDEILSRLSVTPRSTFYVHPNGSWWFYDQHRIYNRYGIPLRGDFKTYLSDFIANGYIEHVIYDAVHLENSRGTLDTSFLELYNQAVAKLPADTVSTPEVAKFQSVTKDDVRATIEKQSIADPVAGAVLQLKVTLGPEGNNVYPNTWYFFDTAIYDATDTHIPVDFGHDGWGTLQLTLGDVYWSSPAFWSYYHTSPPVGTPSGTLWYPAALNTPFTVASVVMIT